MSTHTAWANRLQRDGRRVVILDDDPTGTQTVANVEVILQPSLEAYHRFFAGSERAVYILTNTRALSAREAVALVTTICNEVERTAQEHGQSVAFLLRGDSTLRGHVFAEIDAFASHDSVSLFVPAFPEGGRVTIHGIHYIQDGENRVPVAQMEFARDTVFGYQSERLVDWVAEVGQGRAAISLPLEQVREQGATLITQTLLEAPAGTVILPDAETRADLEIIATGLLDAEEQGRHIVTRSASTFAAVRAGLHSVTVASVNVPADSTLLVVCGSHTTGSTKQLERLVEYSTSPVIIPTNWLLTEGIDAVVPRLVQQIRQQLTENKFAILATERIRQANHGDLSIGAQVMAALTAVVAKVATDCDAIITKGGITSAQVATDGLGAKNARVQGQLQAGVALWDVAVRDGRHIPYAVVPGNVGNEQTLVDVALQFHAPAVKTGNGFSAIFQPIEQKSVVAEVTQRLLEYLLSGSLKPGSRLPSERQLAEALGMGRSTLRESLKALTILGLLEVRQGDGTYLRRADSTLLPRVIEWGLLLGEKWTMDLIEARQRIEVITAELAAQRRDHYAVEELRVILDRLHKAGTDYQAYVDADVAFHLKLAEIARNSALRDILSSIQALLRTWIIRVIKSAGTTDFSYREHLAIFAAVERGDPQAAIEAMRSHMDSATTRLIKTIEHEEYFV